MSLRTKPIYRIGNRPNHFLGGDREVVLFFAIMGGLLVFQGTSAGSKLFGVLVWVLGLAWARAMVKRDPQWRKVWARRRQYAGVYLAHSTPFRSNTPRQGGRYAR